MSEVSSVRANDAFKWTVKCPQDSRSCYRLNPAGRSIRGKLATKPERKVRKSSPNARHISNKSERGIHHRSGDSAAWEFPHKTHSQLAAKTQPPATQICQYAI